MQLNMFSQLGSTNTPGNTLKYHNYTEKWPIQKTKTISFLFVLKLWTEQGVVKRTWCRAYSNAHHLCPSAHPILLTWASECSKIHCCLGRPNSFKLASTTNPSHECSSMSPETDCIDITFVTDAQPASYDMQQGALGLLFPLNHSPAPGQHTEDNKLITSKNIKITMCFRIGEH